MKYYGTRYHGYMLYNYIYQVSEDTMVQIINKML